ncbi:triose-phosphate isomerase [Tepidimicrobium xylanilyticum]|uniref:Triosephosphate isomerase n=1 Tax=Tepidimicrobium xylanilyticum TaxID=1123352 RepID=A0A1H3A087_9FIRM|nr:triose-phosphate isomerase [Tepidimicrobium xylanilyticum]GMG96351.1 triosephosphate isomerase [Tepidimicrobium xylanilyticum]SDX23192.1 triosephosphate isomerase [Tepidimicrobium xylanilyticum]
MRVPIIAGNWKMNNTISESLALIEAILNSKLSAEVEKVVAVPFTSLMEVKKALKGTDIKVAAQNMHWEDNGAYTGEVSPLMLKEIGVDYCIIGHSERRQYFCESDETVNKKVKSALKHGIKPILCVGETLEEREEGKEEEVVKRQLLKALEDVAKKDIGNVVIAYEPVWAIGTGKTASSEDANNMCGFIRKVVGEKYEEEIKEVLRIQYGGSVKPSNIKELMAKEEIDGALVGGASLIAEDFVKIVNY